MSAAERRICALCGQAFALVMPPGEEETERDKLCSDLPGPAGAAGRGAAMTQPRLTMEEPDLLADG